MSDKTKEKYGALAVVMAESFAYFRELQGESDRAAVILAAANFEDWLRQTIMVHFVRSSKAVQERIFENSGPLSTFSAKIDIAYALGIYDEQTRKSLHTVRKIRNEFAHTSKAITFDNAKLASMCRGLAIGDDSQADDLRVRYLTYLLEVRETVMKMESPFSRILVQH